MATEEPLYGCHTQDWAGGSLSSSFPTGKRLSSPSPVPGKIQSWAPLERARRGWGLSQSGLPDTDSSHQLLLNQVPSTADHRREAGAGPCYQQSLSKASVPHRSANPNHARFRATPHLTGVHWGPSSAEYLRALHHTGELTTPLAKLAAVVHPQGQAPGGSPLAVCSSWYQTARAGRQLPS